MAKPKMQDRLYQRATPMTAADRNLEPIWIINAWIATGNFEGSLFTLQEFHEAYLEADSYRNRGSSLAKSRNALTELVRGAYIRESWEQK